MKNLIQLMLAVSILSSCGVDTGQPSTLLGGGSGGGYDTITPGDGQARIEPVSFGDFDKFVNQHPEIRRTSVYRLYKQDGRKFILQEDFAKETSLTGSFEGTSFKLVLYKEKLGTKKVGQVAYFEMKDDKYERIELSDSEFIESGDSSVSDTYLEFRLYQAGNLYKSFQMSLDRETNELNYIHSTEDGAQATSILTITQDEIDELKSFGGYINTEMVTKVSCKKLSAGNVVSINEYTTLATRSLEYRNCYWDLYDDIVKQYVTAHKNAVNDGDAKGVKCRSARFTDIKNNLLIGKEKCKNDFEQK